MKMYLNETCGLVFETGRTTGVIGSGPIGCHAACHARPDVAGNAARIIAHIAGRIETRPTTSAAQLATTCASWPATATATARSLFYNTRFQISVEKKSNPTRRK